MRNSTKMERAKPFVHHHGLDTFDSILRGFFDGDKKESRTIRPASNILEDKNGNICIELSAPGFDRNDFNIELDGQELVISAKQQESEEKSKGKIYHSEFSSYEIERSFTLSKRLDLTSVTAKYENGILTISIKRKPEPEQTSKRKNIKIQ